MIGKR